MMHVFWDSGRVSAKSPSFSDVIFFLCHVTGDPDTQLRNYWPLWFQSASAALAVNRRFPEVLRIIAFLMTLLISVSCFWVQYKTGTSLALKLKTGGIVGRLSEGNKICLLSFLIKEFCLDKLNLEKCHEMTFVVNWLYTNKVTDFCIVLSKWGTGCVN